MLPNVKTMKSSAIAALLAVSLAVPAAPAFAWGQREQDVLKGVLGTLAIGAIINEANKGRRPAAQPQHYYVDPRPQGHYVEPRPQQGHGHGYNNGHRPRTPDHYAYNSVHGTPAAQAFNTYTRGERQQIQRKLARHGYYNGGIDGSFGAGTYRAIAAYARDTGNADRLSSRNGAFALFDSLIF
jgi:hypothetical protein